MDFATKEQVAALFEQDFKSITSLIRAAGYQGDEFVSSTCLGMGQRSGVVYKAMFHDSLVAEGQTDYTFVYVKYDADGKMVADY